AADDEFIRERATVAREFDPAEIHHGCHSASEPPVAVAVAPLVVVIAVNVLMSFVVLPRLDLAFLAEERWGATSPAGVAGVFGAPGPQRGKPGRLRRRRRRIAGLRCRA